MKFSKKLLFIPFLAGLLLLAGCADTDSSVDASKLSVVNSGKVASIDVLSHDWGDIDIAAGDVEHTFTLKNNSDKELIVKTGSTSCMCTEAEVKLAGGTTSPKFGMHGRIDWGGIVAPNEEFDVRVIFDPMAHGPNGTGPISRAVYLLTSSVDNGQTAMFSEKNKGSITEIKVMGDVLSSKDYEEKMNPSFTYKNIDASTLKSKLVSKDFFLVDTHIPEQEHIEGTDAFIAYNEIEANLDKLPKDKSEPIVVYCRSGSMSMEASQKLIDLGYTDVTNVLGGRNAYVELDK